MMLWGFIAALALQMAQPNPAPAGAQTSYTVILHDDTKLHVLWDARESIGPGLYRLQLDTPWEPGHVTIRDTERKGEPRPERMELRKQRYEEHGWTLVNGRPVALRELELARQARQMAAAVSAPAPPSATETRPAGAKPPMAADGNNAPAARPGFVARWGAHAALLAVAALLLTVVIRLTFLRES